MRTNRRWCRLFMRRGQPVLLLTAYRVDWHWRVSEVAWCCGPIILFRPAIWMGR